MTDEPTKKKRIKKPGWTIYGVTEESRKIIRLYAAELYKGQGETIDLIVKEWSELKSKSQNEQSQ